MTEPTPPSDPSYDERLVVPLGWWFGALGISLLLAAQIHGGAPGLQAVLPYAIGLPLTVVLLLAGSRGRIRVAEDVLRVPGARIGLHHLGEVVVLDRRAMRQQTGPMADRYAFVVSRPWLRTAVRASLIDPDDDTPYWVIGSRRADQLAAALRAAGAGAPR